MMKNKYAQMVDQIHASAELNQQVMTAARRSTAASAPSREQRWRKVAVCMACVSILVLGSLSLYPYDDAGHGILDTKPTTPGDGLVLTACAADLPSTNANGGLGIALAEDGVGQDGGLFQIKGAGIQTITLSIQGGTLFHEGTEEELTEIQEAYQSDTKYGVRLSEKVATLNITADKEYTRIYQLYREKLRPSQSEDGQVILVPQLTGDSEKSLPGIYAVDASQSRWLIWPVEGTHAIMMGRSYGPTQNGTFHAGIDVLAPAGTAILAAADGSVAEVGYNADEGYYVVVDHGNGLTTRYYHCKRIDVEKDAQVKAGDAIAQVGRTGKAGNDVLHFEVRQDGIAQDPTTYFDSDIRGLLNVG